MIILSIGYQDFVFKSDRAAMSAIKALSDAAQVESDFQVREYVYFPARPDRHAKIEMKIVQPHQLVRCKPGEEAQVKKPARQLDFHGKVHHMGDGGES